MKLSIDQTQSSFIRLKLGNTLKEIQYSSPREQDLLVNIQDFLDEQHVDLTALTAIEVATGPGGFTSLRTSIAIAQSLALALHIPINGQTPGSSIEAVYGKEPNISVPKK